MTNYLAVDIGSTFLGGGSSKLADVGGVSSVVSIFLGASFSLAGIIILYYFILGGIGIISGASQNDPKKLEAAKATATSAIIGFVVVLTAYWIVKLIGRLIGIEDLI